MKLIKKQKSTRRASRIEDSTYLPTMPTDRLETRFPPHVESRKERKLRKKMRLDGEMNESKGNIRRSFRKRIWSFCCGKSSAVINQADVPDIAGRLLRAGSITDEEYDDIVNADFVYRASADGTSGSFKLIQRSNPHFSCGKSQHRPSQYVKSEVEEKARDPITLEELGSWTWRFIADVPVNEDSQNKPHQYSTVYNVDSLVQYLTETGEFYEPITRIPFSYNQMVELENLALLAGVKTGRTLIEAWNVSRDITGYYQEEKEKREMLLGCDRCLGEIVTEMLNAIENSNPEQGQVQLLQLFPQFTHIYNELKNCDHDFAKQCLSSYVQSLKGPPNNPTVDTSELLPAALKFLAEAESTTP